VLDLKPRRVSSLISSPEWSGISDILPKTVKLYDWFLPPERKGVGRQSGFLFGWHFGIFFTKMFASLVSH